MHSVPHSVRREPDLQRLLDIPLLRLFADQLLRVRFIEGPPAVFPGESARVVIELEAEPAGVRSGTELELVDGTKLVGLITVGRLVSSTVPII